MSGSITESLLPNVERAYSQNLDLSGESLLPNVRPVMDSMDGIREQALADAPKLVTSPSHHS